MTEPLAFSLALLIAITGFAALALAMDRHHRDVFGRRPPRFQCLCLRIIGWGCLVASPLPCVAATGLFIGIVFWIGILTVAALATALVLAAPAIAKSGPLVRR